MGRRLILGVVLSLTALVCIPGVAMGRSLVVGSGLGCADGRYSTIQAAVDAARPGDQVPVCPGTYREYVIVTTNRLKIFSRKRHAAVVEVPLNGGAFNLVAQSTLLRGFTIVVDPSVPCDESVDGIYSLAGATIEHNRLRPGGCHEFRDGISNSLAYFPGRFTVAHNDISGAHESAIRLDDRSFDGTVVAAHSNTIRDAGIGVRIDGGTGLVQDNTIEDSVSGIYADAYERGKFKFQVRGNRLRRNQFGIVVYRVNLGVDVPRSQFNVRVEANRVVDSDMDGILIDSSDKTFVYRNRSLGSGRFDCVEVEPAFGVATWKDNIGVTDSPSNLCRAP